MSGYEVANPIVNSPFREPAEHWNIVEGEEPERLSGRRPAMYFYRDPAAKPDSFGRGAGGGELPGSLCYLNFRRF
jgi:type III restriction enzyme